MNGRSSSLLDADVKQRKAGTAIMRGAPERQPCLSPILEHLM